MNESKKYKILITGSKGFIGQHLCKKLKQEAQEIIIPEDYVENFDITNSEHVDKLLELDFDFIVNLAANTFTVKSFENPKETYNPNVFGNFLMLELARKKQIKGFIFSSTAGVYGNTKEIPIKESQPTNILSPYTSSKYLAEKICEHYSQIFKVPCTILRITNPFGKNQSDYMIIPKIIKGAELGKIYIKDLKPKRDFIDIKDVVNAIYLSIINKKQEFELYNIGSGKSYSIGEIINIIKSISDKDIEVINSNERRSNEILDSCVDITLAKENLNWKPKEDLTKSLKSLLNKQE